MLQECCHSRSSSANLPYYAHIIDAKRIPQLRSPSRAATRPWFGSCTLQPTKHPRLSDTWLPPTLPRFNALSFFLNKVYTDLPINWASLSACPQRFLWRCSRPSNPTGRIARLQSWIVRGNCLVRVHLEPHTRILAATWDVLRGEFQHRRLAFFTFGSVL